MLTVYMDESGFTGEDLLSPEQPIFVHVSTSLSDEECIELHREYFSGTQGPELKHKNLSKWSKGQSRVVRFIKALQGDTGKATVWTCHKEFTLLTYLVDLWVEPAMKMDGFDLYRDGGNLAFSNMAYFCLRTFQSERFLTDHLRRFQRMMVQRTAKSYREFFGSLSLDFERVDVRTKRILLSFLGGGMRLGSAHMQRIPKRALDPAFTTAVNTCGHWQKRTTTPFKVIHDQSSGLVEDRPLWDLITSPEIQEMTIGVPGRDMAFPLKVTQVEFADSRSHLQLQFCDLIAGATVAWTKKLVGLPYDKGYVEQLESAGIEALGIGAIWPTPEVDPEMLGTKGMSGEELEKLVDQVSELHNKPQSSQ